MGRNSKKFLCCLPLWSGLLAASILTMLDMVMAIFLLSTTLIFTSMIVLIFFALPLLNNENTCYRKFLFFIYVLFAFLEIPLFVIETIETEGLLEALFVKETCSQTMPDADCHIELLVPKIVFASLAGLALLLIKTYFSCIIFAFSQISSRLHTSKVQDDPENLADWDVPKGQQLSSQDSVCGDVAIAVPIDQDIVEKETQLRRMSSCKRHTVRKPDEK